MNPVGLLNRAPRWVRSMVASVTRGRGPVGALYDRVAHRYDAREIPEVPAASSAPVRLVIGPANEAEQGYQWARAVERNLPGVSAVAMMGFDPGGYRVKADLRVPAAVYLRATAWHDAFERYLDSCTHIVFESGLPLLGRRHHGVVAEIRRFHSEGLRVGMLFHGSDIRLPSRHRAENEWSPFTDRRLPAAIMEDRALRNLRIVEELALPVFVSTPDLLRWLPDAGWCPIVIDPAAWLTDGDARRRRTGPPVVLHAPSNPLIKGTSRIEPVLRALEAEGLLEYRHVSGLPHAQMRDLYAEADIVLEQFLIGGYGVAACEALAAGCLVVGHVDGATREMVRERTGLEVPVIEATVADLEVVVRQLLADPGSHDDTRRRGVAFVEDVHDGRRAAEAFREFLRPTA